MIELRRLPHLCVNAIDNDGRIVRPDLLARGTRLPGDVRVWDESDECTEADACAVQGLRVGVKYMHQSQEAKTRWKQRILDAVKLHNDSLPPLPELPPLPQNVHPTRYDIPTPKTTEQKAEQTRFDWKTLAQRARPVNLVKWEDLKPYLKRGCPNSVKTYMLRWTQAKLTQSIGGWKIPAALLGYPVARLLGLAKAYDTPDAGDLPNFDRLEAERDALSRICTHDVNKPCKCRTVAESRECELARKRATKIAVVNEVLLDMRVNGWGQERYETILAATGLDNVEEEFVAPLEDALDDEEVVREDTDPDGFLWAVGARLGVDIVEDGKAWEFPTDREPLELDGDGVETVRFEGEYPGHPHLPLGVSQYEMMKLDLWDGYVESRAREYQRLQETDWKLADSWLDNGTIWERNAILDKRQELFGDHVPHVADLDPGAIGCEGYEIADDVNVNDLHKIIIAHQLGRVSLDEVKRTAVRSGWVRRSSTIATAHRH